MTDLIDKLQSTGVEVRIKQTRNNVIQGISFAHPDWEHGFKGSDLGKHYSWAGLQTHKCVSYDPVRDADAITTSAINSRASTNQKIAAKHLQIEVADGIAGTVTAESQTASSRISDTSATARSNRGVAVSDRQFEYSVSQPATTDLQSDPGKQLVEAAVSRFNRNADQLTAAVSQLDRSADDFSRRLERTNIFSRKRTEQPERELATAPSGAGSKSRAAREKPAHQIDIATQLDQLGSTVEQANTELELQLGGNQSTSHDTGRNNSTTRNSQPTASTTIGISAADISQQFEEINRIHEGTRRRRASELSELKEDLAAGISFLEKEIDDSSPMAIAQKNWESSPAWQHRPEWERNFLTCAFEELKKTAENFQCIEGATFKDEKYMAYMVNPKSLHILVVGQPVIAYESYRDQEARKCTLTPEQKQAFLPPGQQLEINHEAEQQISIGEEAPNELQSNDAKAPDEQFSFNHQTIPTAQTVPTNQTANRDPSDQTDLTELNQDEDDELISVDPIEENWQPLRAYLIEECYLPSDLLDGLHEEGWVYANNEGMAVFSLRTRENIATGVCIFDPESESNTWWDLNLDPEVEQEVNGEPAFFWIPPQNDLPINDAIITSDPIETISRIALDPSFGQNSTLYLSTESVNSLPIEVLENLEENVVVSFKGDEDGRELEKEVMKALPKRGSVTEAVTKGKVVHQY